MSRGRRPSRRERKTSRNHEAQHAESAKGQELDLEGLRRAFTNPVYLDEEKVCAQCGEPFVVTAGKKRYWHQTLRVTSHVSFDLCPDCLRERRASRALNTQLGRAVESVVRKPDDAAALLALARLTAEIAQDSGTGDLDRGIAAARRARRIRPSLHEALYWEAICQDIAGRTQKATTLYEEFVRSAPGRHRRLIQAARQRIAQAMADNADSSASGFG